MDTITKLADERLSSIVYISNQKICTSEPTQTLPFLFSQPKPQFILKNIRVTAKAYKKLSQIILIPSVKEISSTFRADLDAYRWDKSFAPLGNQTAIPQMSSPYLRAFE